jgi:hypothetical protein
MPSKRKAQPPRTRRRAAKKKASGSTVPEEILQRLFSGGFTHRDEANAIVAFAFRNGPIEDLHAGKYSEILEDKSLSRITDAEMKELMLFACEKVELLLQMREADPAGYGKFLRSYNLMYCGKWKR